MEAPSKVDTLLEHCLKVIVNHADAFASDESADPTFRYVTSPFSHVERHLVSNLLTRLAHAKKLSPSNIGPLLRPDLDAVEIPPSAAPLIGGPFLALLGARCRRLAKLYLPQCKGISNQAFLQLVSQLEPHTLKELDISSCLKVGDSAVAACIQRHQKSLIKFFLPFVPVTSSILCQLRSCDQLEYLDLSGSPNLNDEALLAISSGCTALQSLVLNDCWHASATSISSISSLTALRSLEVSLLAVDDASLRSIVSNCSHLTNINLSSCRELGQDCIFILGRYVGARLKSLRLDGSLGCRNFYELKNCPNLEVLSASGCAVSTWDLCEILPVLTSLSHLSLASVVDVKNPALVSLGASASSKTLRRLDLSGCNAFDDIGLEAVVENAALLEELNLHGCSGISDSLIFKMASLDLLQLQRVDLSNCSKVSPDAVAALVGASPSLKHISLIGCAKIMKQHLDSIQKKNPKAEVLWG